MAMLNQNEKELLKVVRYFNTQRTQTARLVKKLMESFDVEDVAVMTGFDESEVYAWAAMVPERKSSRKVQKVRDDIANSIKELDEDAKNLKPIPFTVNDESTVAERVTHEMSVMIGSRFKSGDKFFSQKEAMAEFTCASVTVSEAFKALVANGWIEFAEPGNFRKGYIVK